MKKKIAKAILAIFFGLIAILLGFLVVRGFILDWKATSILISVILLYASVFWALIELDKHD